MLTKRRQYDEKFTIIIILKCKSLGEGDTRVALVGRKMSQQINMSLNSERRVLISARSAKQAR